MPLPLLSALAHGRDGHCGQVRPSPILSTHYQLFASHIYPTCRPYISSTTHLYVQRVGDSLLTRGMYMADAEVSFPAFDFDFQAEPNIFATEGAYQHWQAKEQ